MTFTLLKIASYSLALTAPVMILVGVTRWMRKKSVSIVKQRLVKAILVPIVWCIGLFGFLAGQAFHEIAWHSANPDGIVTEEDMDALGDYPNVSVAWILMGWIPVVVGVVLSARSTRNQTARKAAR